MSLGAFLAHEAPSQMNNHPLKKLIFWKLENVQMHHLWEQTWPRNPNAIFQMNILSDHFFTTAHFNWIIFYFSVILKGREQSRPKWEITKIYLLK